MAVVSLPSIFLCVFQDFAGRDAARHLQQRPAFARSQLRLDVGNDTLNHVQFRAGAVMFRPR